MQDIVKALWMVPLLVAFTSAEKQNFYMFTYSSLGLARVWAVIMIDWHKNEL